MKTLNDCEEKFNCSQDENWKKCFKRNSLLLHPDKGGNAEEWKILSNCNDFVNNVVSDIN